MIFKDGDAKDLGLNIMRCASLKYAQILPIKYVLPFSVKAVGAKDERVRKAMLMWPLELSKGAGRDPGGQARWPGLSLTAFWACPTVCCQ